MYTRGFTNNERASAMVFVDFEGKMFISRPKYLVLETFEYIFGNAIKVVGNM